MNGMNRVSPSLGRFSENPAESWTLPGMYYYDNRIFTEELERIFYRTWQYACHVSRLKNSGDYYVRDIGDQSILVLRDDNGEIQAYHNVCQHRAHRLLEGHGKTGKLITCPYHSWCYRLNGKLQFARGSEGVQDFPADEIHLQAVRTDSICGFVFINLDLEAKPMSEEFPGLEEDILGLAPNAENLVLAHSHDYKLAANWKNSVENYSECYHCPNRHPSLVNGALDITQYRIKTRNGYQRHVTTDVGDNQMYAMSSSPGQSTGNFGSWLVWPSMVFEVYPGGNLTTFNHVPLEPERTLQETEWYFTGSTPSKKEKEVIDFVQTVREEDIPICESVQRGLHSRGYKQGRFVVDRDRTYVSEHAVHDFQLRVIKALNKPL